MKIRNEKLKANRRKVQRGKPKNDKWILYLYVAGQTTKAITALNNIKSICKEQLQNKYYIERIDLLKNPQLGRYDQILAIPTLIRRLPLPAKLVIGDLSNTAQVLAGLNLKDLR